MLWDMSSLRNYHVEASDGRLGTVSDFLFDDKIWAIRWLVVDTGHWLSGRKVLLPLSALGSPDPSQREFPVKLTKRQVEDSPDIDADRPVSRQHESHLYDYYGWAPGWDGGFVPPDGAIATPFLAPSAFSGQASPDAVRADAQPSEGDPHLRSIGEVTGYHVHATDGEIGHVEDFIVDEEAWTIRYALIDTGNWLPGKQILVAPQWIAHVDWKNSKVYVNLSREAIKTGPEFDPNKIDRDYEKELYKHYGRENYWWC